MKPVFLLGLTVLLSIAQDVSPKSTTPLIRGAYVNADRPRELVASWYGPRFHGRKTANGERFNMFYADCSKRTICEATAAHRTLPFGTKIRLTNPRNGKRVIVRINDRGPYPELVKSHRPVRWRHIDLSWKAASLLGMADQGIARLKAEILWIPQRNG